MEHFEFIERPDRRPPLAAILRWAILSFGIELALVAWWWLR